MIHQKFRPSHLHPDPIQPLLQVLPYHHLHEAIHLIIQHRTRLLLDHPMLLLHIMAYPHPSR